MENNKSQKIVNNVFWSFAEKFMTDFVSLFVSVVLARYLFPEDYGLISILQLIIGIISIVLRDGLGTALIQNKEADEEEISTIFYLNIISGIILYILLFIFAPLIAKYWNRLELIIYIRVLGVKLIIDGVYAIQHAYVKKNMAFKKFFMSSFGGTVASGVVGIYMAVNGYGAWALVFSTLIDEVMDCVVLFFSTKWIPKFYFSIKKSKKTIIFGIKVFLTEFITIIHNQLRSLVIGFKYAPEDLAYNTKGQKFPQMIIDVTTAVVGNVMFPVLSNVNDDRESTLKISKTSLQISSFFVFPMLMGMLGTANVFIPVLLTKRWLSCVPFVIVYCLSNMTSPFVTIDSRIIHASGNGNLLIKTKTINTVMGIICIAVSVFLFNNAFSIACSLLVSNIISTMILMEASNKLVGYGILEHIKDVFKEAVCSVSMGIIVYLIGKVLTAHQILTLFIQVVCGITYYFVICLVLKPLGFSYVLDYIKKYLYKKRS